MKSHHVHRCLTLVVAVAILAGCAGSPHAKFYQLNPLPTGNSGTSGGSLEHQVTIAVGPVRIPDYLDRPQIVTRSEQNQLNISEFDRWAGSLESDVARVLMENLSILLPRDRFSVMTWKPYQESRQPDSYRVDVLVERFEGAPGQSLILKAQWEVLDHDRRSLVRKESLIRERINGGSYDALVSAMSAAMERLSRDIAGGMNSVLK